MFNNVLLLLQIKEVLERLVAKILQNGQNMANFGVLVYRREKVKWDHTGCKRVKNGHNDLVLRTMRYKNSRND